MTSTRRDRDYRADMAADVVVVMAVHQGRAHLPAQLESIAAQTRRPDLVIVRDDVSTDGSDELARSMLRASGLPHALTRNAQRLGAVGTFAAGLEQVGSAELVVLCDQDDVWHPERLATVTRELAARPDVDLVFSDGRVVDRDGEPLPGTLWQHAGFTGALRQRWDQGDHLGVLLQQNVVTGAATAFRGRLLDRALPMPVGGWHDAWLALLAVTTGVAWALPEQLIDYRLHGGNAVGLVRPSTVGQVRTSTGRSTADRAALLRRELGLFVELEQRLADLAGPEAAAGRVREKRELLELRLDLPRRVPARARAIAAARHGYAAYSLGLPSVLNDLVRPLRDGVPPAAG